jgi:hypothetical protein
VLRTGCNFRDVNTCAMLGPSYFTPTPISKSSDGRLLDESGMLRVPGNRPSAPGVKVTVIRQLASKAKGDKELQLSVSW